MTSKAIFFTELADGFYCQIDGEPDYFKEKHQLYMTACMNNYDVIRVTKDNAQNIKDYFNVQLGFSV